MQPIQTDCTDPTNLQALLDAHGPTFSIPSPHAVLNGEVGKVDLPISAQYALITLCVYDAPKMIYSKDDAVRIFENVIAFVTENCADEIAIMAVRLLWRSIDLPPGYLGKSPIWEKFTDKYLSLIVPELSR